MPTDTSLNQPATSTLLDGKKIYNALKQRILVSFGDAGWGAVGLSLTGGVYLVLHRVD